MVTKINRYVLFKKMIYTLILMLTIDIFLSFLYYSNAKSTLDDIALPKCYDAGVVFFHSLTFNNEISNESKRRLFHAFNLYNAGQIKKIIIVGGNRPESGMHGSKIMMKELKKVGMPAGDIYYDLRSYDTISNIKEAVIIAKNNNIKTMTFISSPLHLYRILKISVKEKINAGFSPHENKDNYSFKEFYSLWLNINKEWVVFSMMTMLPDNLYNRIIHWLRS